MEMTVLQALQWRLNGPTPHDIDSYLHAILFADSRHLQFLSTCSKALVERAVKMYDVALQYPSVITCTSICCALQYLEVISSLDSTTVLHYMKSVSGLDFEDPAARSLYGTMVKLIQEFLPDVSSSRGSIMVDRRSVSTEGSPTGIVHDA
jgi:hypothetical protein